MSAEMLQETGITTLPFRPNINWGWKMDKDIPRYIKKYIECRCCNGSGSCTMSQTAAQIKCPYCEDGYKPIFEEEHKLEVE